MIQFLYGISVRNDLEKKNTFTPVKFFVIKDLEKQGMVTVVPTHCVTEIKNGCVTAICSNVHYIQNSE